jgi:seryl-tRNA synthetase
MTIGIQILREGKAGGDPERVRASEKKRFRDPKLVDDVIELDQQWVKAQYNTEQKRKEIGVVQKSITERKKADSADKCEDLMKQKSELEGEVADLVKESDTLMEKRDTKLGLIGNLVPSTKEEDEKEGHSDLAVFKDEDHNLVVGKWGVPRSFDGLKYGTNGFRPHFELLEMLGAVEFDAGREVAGERAYFLTGPGVLLNQALLNYGLAFLSQRGYTPVQPPFFMKKDLMAKTAELADYDDVLYKIVEDKERPELDKYLIATSEQPISAMHKGQNIDQNKFPMKYAGISSCFRREAGSSGRDIRGIFRVHQFEKIEQFVYTKPEDSWEEHKRMIDMAAEFWQSLGIPYHVISIVTGALNNAAAKKYDLEGWFPGDDDGKGKYRELVSCSNCLDYQARAMNVKYGFKPTDPFCHMLNSTLCATERGLCCLVENYQEAEGVRVPRALVPFMLGQEFLPFVKTLKETGGKQGGKQEKAGSKQEKQGKQEQKGAAKDETKAAAEEKLEAAEKTQGGGKQEKQGGGKQEKQGKQGGKKK